uniref:Uncharacterized protein n=1 Tax=Magallana gigas TaxID=29159 RepID=K1PCN8_MAGGI
MMLQRCTQGSPHYLSVGCKMRGIQCFVFCALLYSIQVDAFGFCSLDSECPANAECDDNDLGICSPFDSEVDDCGENGQCAIIQGEHGIYKAVCKCDYGYYGKFCDDESNPNSNYYNTKRRARPRGLHRGSFLEEELLCLLFSPEELQSRRPHLARCPQGPQDPQQ